MNGKLTVGSLFSGIGGLELGLERTGRFETRWQCEINEYARKVLAKNWPGLPIYNDIKELYESEWPEKVNVLCGGFPCQPFSTVGKRQGESDERFLWPEFVRVVREVQPRWVIAENVPGLLTIDSGRVFGRILWDLASCGYDAEWDTISAASVGALHPRNRIFIVGRLRDADRTPGQLPFGRVPFRAADAWGDGQGQAVLADAEHPGRDGSEIKGSIGAGGHDHQAGTITPMQPSGLRIERSLVADPDRSGLQAEVSELRAAGIAGESPSLSDAELARAWNIARSLSGQGWQLPGALEPTPVRQGHRADGSKGAFPGGPAVPDAQGQRGRSGDVRRQWFQADAGPLEFGWRYNRPGMFFDASREWWAVEPNVGRVANGVPARVDRLRCLGNAVVPQCAEYIGERILEWEGLI